jgi:hypothetical protein
LPPEKGVPVHVSVVALDSSHPMGLDVGNVAVAKT